MLYYPNYPVSNGITKLVVWHTPPPPTLYHVRIHFSSLYLNYVWYNIAIYNIQIRYIYILIQIKFNKIIICLKRFKRCQLFVLSFFAIVHIFDQIIVVSGCIYAKGKLRLYSEYCSSTYHCFDKVKHE